MRLLDLRRNGGDKEDLEGGEGEKEGKLYKYGI